ncbi:MAG: hypothetical protein KDD90_07420 [Sphingomonadaceae bacterium]|jgi:hypothetical protein|nr:hypothetical protein [Sphingomonadaceae bacterium]MCP5384992.1 hypothetical protein [Altererythrobacter sp.]
MRYAAIALTLPLFTLALPAQAGEPKEPETEDTAKAETPKKICRYVTDGMGSRRKRRLCLTEQEWIDFNRGQ